MNHQAFKEFITRAEIAGARRFTQEQSMVLYQRLHNIADDKWAVVAEQFLQSDPLPKNIEAFIRSAMIRLADAEVQKSERPWTHTNEVSYEQHELFFECISLAIDAFKQNYYSWVQGFNKLWAMFSGEELTKVLRKTKMELTYSREEANLPF